MFYEVGEATDGLSLGFGTPVREVKLKPLGVVLVQEPVQRGKVVRPLLLEMLNVLLVYIPRRVLDNLS